MEKKWIKTDLWKNRKENMREIQIMAKYKEALFPLSKYLHIMEENV